MANTRTQTATITLPSGTPAGPLEFPTVLDKQFARATGVAAYVNANGGIPTFKLGLRDDTGPYISPTNVSYLRAGSECPKNQRMTPVDIKCDGTNLTIQLTLPAVLTAALEVDVVFELTK